MIGGGVIGAAADKGITGGIAIKEANKSWKRTKRAMQNAVRWRVSDLRAAGLNPILAANMGFGGGGGPTAATPSLPSGNAAEAGASSAKSFATAKRDQKMLGAIDAQTKLYEQQQAESRWRSYALQNQGMRDVSHRNLYDWQSENLSMQNQLLKFEMPRAARQAELWSGKSGEMMKARDASQGWFQGMGLGGRFRFGK